MKKNFFFLLILGLSFSVNAQVKLSNGLSYKVQFTAGKPANYFVVDVGKNKAEVSKTNRYIVKFKSDPELKAKIKKAKSTVDRDHLNFDSDLNKIESAHRQNARAIFSETKIHHHFTKAFNGKAITASPQVVEDLRKLPYVHSVVEDKQIKVSDNTSNGIIEADKVWSNLGITGKGIVIGIIDTGIDYNHPDIGDGFGPSHKVIGGYDFVNNDGNPMDDHGHGTHVAGIAAANGPSLKGVAPDAKLIAYKVLTAEGWGYSSWIIAGIEKCVDPDGNPNTNDMVDVVNMSVGGPTNGPDEMSEAVDNAVQAGIVFAIAAGNSGDYQTIGSPGIAQYAITVGATDSFDQLAYFSSKGPSADNYGLKPDICAPGVNIYSSLPGKKYDSWSGTSMATPHVAGAAALLLQLHPGWTPAQVKATLMENATPLGGGPFEIGTGRLDVLKAANATFTVTPGSISFGIIDKSQPIAHKNFQLTVSNFSNQAKIFTVTPSGDLTVPGISSSIDKTSVSLAAGASQVVNVSVSMEIASLPVRDIPNLYLGFVNVSDNTMSVKVPVGFVNPQTIHAHFDTPLPTMFVISGADNYYYKNIFPTSSELDIPLPAGQFNFIALYDQWTYVVAKEMISVPGSGSIAFSKTEASNAIVHQPVDENGEKLNFQYGALSTASISLNQSQGSGFFVLFGGKVDTLHLSSLTTHWNIGFSANDSPVPGGGKLYSLNTSLNGVSHSAVLTNNPADFVPITYQYDQNLKSTVGVTSFLTYRPSPWIAWSFWGYSHQMPSNFTEFHQKSDKSSNGSYMTTQQVIDASANMGYSFQAPQLSIYKNDSTVFYRGVLQSVAETNYLHDPSIELHLNETLLQWSAAMTNDETKIVVNPTYSDGYFVNNRGDKVLGKITYSLSNSSGLIKKDSVINPRLGEAWLTGDKYLTEENLVPGAYSLNMNFSDYQVQGQYGKATADLSFNTAGYDKNPPYLNKFDLTVNGHLVNHFNHGEPAILTLSVSDDCYPFNYPCIGSSSGVASYSLQYKKLTDAAWKDLVLVNDAAAIPTNLEDGFYSLKFYSADNSGNTFTYTIEPAFLVGTNPNPIPFRRPALISPKNKTALVPQNPHFKWAPMQNANQFHFEISTDSSFSKFFRVGDFASDSIRLDTLLKSETKYFWRVRAKYVNSVSPWSEVFSFTTGTGIDGPITLIAPANNSTGLGPEVLFQWSQSPQNQVYEIQYGSEAISSDGQAGTSSVGIVWPGQNYQWRVRARSVSMVGDWSTTFRFSTKLPTLSIVSPQNHETGVSIAPTLSWANDFTDGTYRIQVSTSADFSDVLVDTVSLYSPSLKLHPLQFETTYYWRVQVSYYPNVSVWSNVSIFQTGSQSQLFQNVVLLSPTNQSIDQGLRTWFEWQSFPAPVEYKLIVSTSPDLSDPITVSTSAHVIYGINGLKPFTKYYWKVVVNYLGADYSSGIFSFRTTPIILGIEEKKSMEVYPNPASSEVNFKFGSADKHEVVVVNSLGQLVWNFSGNEQTVTWHTSSIQSGLFFARIKDGEQTVNTKIVIQH